MKFIDANSRGGVVDVTPRWIYVPCTQGLAKDAASTSEIDSYNEGVRIGRKYVRMRGLTESAQMRSMRPSWPHKANSDHCPAEGG
jgi:hypothetical protein